MLLPHSVKVSERRLTGKLLLTQRMKAFLVKRLIYFQRKWLLLVSQVTWKSKVHWKAYERKS